MHRRGGQISGIRSEHKFRPSLDQEEPARSLKCTIEAVVQLHFGVLAIEISDIGRWKCQGSLQQECRNHEMIWAIRSRFDVDRWSNPISRFRILEVGVSKHYATRMLKSRYAKSRYDLSCWIKIRSEPSNHKTSGKILEFCWLGVNGAWCGNSRDLRSR